MGLTDWPLKAGAMRACLGEVEACLLHPALDVWENCTPKLEHLARLMRSFEAELAETETPLSPEERAALRQEIEQVQRQLRRVAALAQGAAGYYSGWGEIVALALGGYGQHGRPVAAPPPLQLVVHG